MICCFMALTLESEQRPSERHQNIKAIVSPETDSDTSQCLTEMNSVVVLARDFHAFSTAARNESTNPSGALTTCSGPGNFPLLTSVM